MKRMISMVAALLLLAGILTGCSNSSNTNVMEKDGKLSIVCTIFPEYDWVKNIVGNETANAELTMLLDNGVDLHSYQPTADDIIKISTCDLFIYVGGESDVWIEDALKEAVNKQMIAIDLLSVLGDAAKEEEVKEGMERNVEGEKGGEDETEYDEHVWLSLKNARLFCTVIAEKLALLDAEHAAVYAENTKTYLAALDALDANYQKTIDEAKNHTLLFGDRFPFRYLSDDYGLDYYAAFVGCSAETEASFETIAYLANKMDELGLNSVLTIEGTEHKVAETIIENTAKKDQSVLILDSMQSTSSQDMAGGASYLSIMRSNLAVLKDALN